MAVPEMSRIHSGNRLLALLPYKEYQRLLPHLELVPLEFKQVLFEAGERIGFVYFPCTAVISWLTVMEDGSSVEVATVGNEGMTGRRVMLGGARTSGRVIVQVPGSALRLESALLKAEAKRNGPLAQLFFRYLNVFLTQITQLAACGSLHSLEKRCCRWLLMTHDRVGSDQFPLTHEFLAQMLRVRRASVTEIARKLQKAGLIAYRHGKITILDRQGLEAASCECYRVVRREFDNLLG